jgi:hypothetical protein
MPVLYQIVLWLATLGTLALGILPSYWANLLKY